MHVTPSVRADIVRASGISYEESNLLLTIHRRGPLSEWQIIRTRKKGKQEIYKSALKLIMGSQLVRQKISVGGGTYVFALTDKGQRIVNRVNELLGAD